jgi:hypothetical protein
MSVNIYTNPTNTTIIINLFRSNLRANCPVCPFCLGVRGSQGPCNISSLGNGQFWVVEGGRAPGPHPFMQNWTRISKLECYSFLAHLQAVHTYCIISKVYIIYASPSNIHNTYYMYSTICNLTKIHMNERTKFLVFQNRDQLLATFFFNGGSGMFNVCKFVNWM